MQALKALVIIMGVLIVLGTTVVVVTIYNRLNSGGTERGATERAAGPASPTPASFGTATVALPDGCRASEMVPGGDRLLLRLGGGPGCDGILVLDLNTGRQLGKLEFVTEP